MVTRKSQYGWMVLGGILCLCGGVVALKLREGNPAVAQTEAPRPPAPPTAPDDPPQSGSKSSHEIANAALAGPGRRSDRRPVGRSGAGAAPAPLVGPMPSEATPPLPLPPGPPMSDSAPLPTKAEPPLPPPPQPPADVRPTRGPESSPPAVQLPPMWSDPTAPPGADATRLAPPPPSADPIRVTSPAVVQASQVGEPPLAGMGPLQSYRVRGNGETMRDIARHTLGTGERCTEVYKLNPGLHAEDTLAAGTVVHLPPDACLPAEEVEGLKPLPAMRPTTAPAKPKVRDGADRHLSLQPRRQAHPHAAARRPRPVRRRRRGAGVARPGPVPVADRPGPPGAAGGSSGAFAGPRGRCARLQAALLRPDRKGRGRRRRPRHRSPIGWPSSPG